MESNLPLLDIDCLIVFALPLFFVSQTNPLTLNIVSLEVMFGFLIVESCKGGQIYIGGVLKRFWKGELSMQNCNKVACNWYLKIHEWMTALILTIWFSWGGFDVAC